MEAESWLKIIVSQGFAVAVAGYLLCKLDSTMRELRDGIRELIQLHRDRERIA